MGERYVDKKLFLGRIAEKLRLAPNIGAPNCVANSRSSPKRSGMWTIITNKGAVTSRHHHVGPIGEVPYLPCVHTLGMPSTK